MEREFSFLLDGDRVRGRFDRVDIDAARPRRAGAGDGRRRDPASGADVVEPTLGLSPRAGRDHGLQVVGRPRPGEGAPAGEGLAPAVDLRDGLRGDDRAAARTRSRCTSSTRASSGRRRSTASRIEKARETIRTAARGIRARDFTAKPDYLSCSFCAFREICPSSVGALTDGAARRPTLGGDRGRARGRGAGRGRRGRQPRRAARAARRLRRPRYADPPFATGEHAAAVARSGPGSGEQTRRGFGGRDVPLRGRVRPRVVRRPAARRPPRGARAPVWSRSTASSRRTARCTSTSTGGPSTTSRLLLDEVFGAERFLNELVWAYDYGGRPRDRWPRKHDTILWYAKGDDWVFEREAIDRVPYLAPGLVGPGEGGARQAADRRVVDDDRAAGLRRADRLPDPEAGPAARAHRRGVEPAGRPRPRPVRGQRHDRRRRGAPRSSLAARRPQPRRRRDRPRAARPEAP